MSNVSLFKQLTRQCFKSIPAIIVPIRKIDLKNDINLDFIESSFAYFMDNLHPMELHYLNESVNKGKLQARVDFTRKLIRIGFHKRKALKRTNLKESQIKNHIIQRHINPQYNYLRRIGFEKGKIDENKDLEKKLNDILL